MRPRSLPPTALLVAVAISLAATAWRARAPRESSAETTASAGYAVRLALRVPFEGVWTLGWGGRALVLGYHPPAGNQGFEYDLAVAKMTHPADDGS